MKGFKFMSLGPTVGRPVIGPAVGDLGFSLLHQIEQEQAAASPFVTSDFHEADADKAD